MNASKRYPPTFLATAVCPWDENYQFLEPEFRRQIAFLAERLTRNLYIFGTAGEGYAVDRDLFCTVTSSFREACREWEVTPMVGLISYSLREIQWRIEYCLDLGIKEFQLAFPGWGTLTGNEQDRFFEETCGRFPEGVFLHYNNKRSGVRLQPEDVARAAETHPNFVGMKHTIEEPERMVEYLEAAPEIQFFVGEPLYRKIRPTHEVGLLPSICLVHPERALRLFRARTAETLEVEAEGLPQVLEAILAGKACGAHIDAAFDKQFVKLHDTAFPLRLLPPYTGCGDEEFKMFQANLPASWRTN